MGCFSFRCNECGGGIESSSFKGHKCRLYLLKKGKVIQEMRGEYDSYGGVFINGTQNPEVKHALRESQEWNVPKHKILEWGDVCDLMFSERIDTGIAGVHEKCFKTIPKVKSARDPNQGWGGTKKIPGYNGENMIKAEMLREKIWDFARDLDMQYIMAKINGPDEEDTSDLKRQETKLKRMLNTYEKLSGEKMNLKRRVQRIF